ncbi:hypothetical protein NDU88_003016 [Pleurodeles waltl]|uniref:Uncharacterized protein n=1 Tax=Pleurodeles waltl TaxID=8319 RepID=A0AAV7WMT9_PLEWA|nr:hypothetical protein NDU88_003016 [Pleurodeles waltl]
METLGLRRKEAVPVETTIQMPSGFMVPYLKQKQSRYGQNGDSTTDEGTSIREAHRIPEAGTGTLQDNYGCGEWGSLTMASAFECITEAGGSAEPTLVLQPGATLILGEPNHVGQQ